MSWQKNDDKFRRHPKTRRALRLGGRDVIAFWLFCGGEVAEAGTDGVVTPEMIEASAYDLRLDDDEVPPLLSALTESGLWHDRRTIRSCRCSVASKHVAKDGAYFHDWCDWNLTNDQSRIPIERLREMRRRELLHNRRLCEAIVARDGEHCRYCGVLVNFGDRRGKAGGTYDHLDPALFTPNLGNFLDGVVVACRTCNGQKKNRTPAEWLADGGRPLLPVPEPYLLDPDLSAIRTGPDRDLTGPGPDLTSRAHPARDGSGQTGPGLDQNATWTRSEVEHDLEGATT